MAPLFTSAIFLLSIVFAFVVVFRALGYLKAIEQVLRNIDKNLVEAATEAKKRSAP